MFRSKETRKRRMKYEKMDRYRTDVIDPEAERKLPSKSCPIKKMVCFTSSFLTRFSFAVFQYASENPLTRVFTWGMACYGALGVPEHLRPKQRRKAPLQAMHRPARCEFAETARVRDVACGYGFTLFALDGKESHIMGTGINKDGQIGMKLRVIMPR